MDHPVEKLSGTTTRDEAVTAEEAIGAEVDARLAHEVHVAVDYDTFFLAPGLGDASVAVVRGIAERRYSSVSRFTTSAFMRLELGGNLAQRGPAPSIYESRQDALGNVGEHS